MNIVQNTIQQLQDIKNPFERVSLYLKWLKENNIKQTKKLRKI